MKASVRSTDEVAIAPSAPIGSTKPPQPSAKIRLAGTSSSAAPIITAMPVFGRPTASRNMLQATKSSMPGRPNA